MPEDPSSGDSLDPFLRRDQIRQQFVVDHKVETFVKHTFSHRCNQLAEGGEPQGHAYSTAFNNHNQRRLVNVTEVYFNKHSV